MTLEDWMGLSQSKIIGSWSALELRDTDFRKKCDDGDKDAIARRDKILEWLSLGGSQGVWD